MSATKGTNPKNPLPQIAISPHALNCFRGNTVPRTGQLNYITLLLIELNTEDTGTTDH